MAPSTTTQDYYNTLGVDQNAPLELITRAYRRLALKLHPDRGGSTQAFQLLGLAYETLNDENKGRAYDQIFPSIGRTRANPQRNSGTQTPRPAPAPTPQSEIRRDDEQLAALREESKVRGAQWRVKRESLMSPIITLRQSIRVMEQEIKDSGDAAAAEAAFEALKRNPTASDLLSALSIEDDDDEKARKDRRRRRREIRNDIESEDWQLGLREAELQGKEKVFNQAKGSVDAADLITERRIQAIEVRVHARKAREQQERENEMREKERRQRFMKQAREAQEAARKRQAEMQKSRQAMRDQRAEAQKVRDDAQRARDDAQRARDDAQRARDDEQRARDAAQRVRDDAQKTRDDAQRVRDDTQRAKDTAQGAKDTAQRTKNTAQRVRDDA